MLLLSYPKPSAIILKDIEFLHHYFFTQSLLKYRLIVLYIFFCENSSTFSIYFLKNTICYKI